MELIVCLLDMAQVAGTCCVTILCLATSFGHVKLNGLIQFTVDDEFGDLLVG